jgi:hypothetical protein
LAAADIEDLGTFQTGECVNLLRICDNCTSANITSVTFPNSTFAINGAVEMGSTDGMFNYSFCGTSTKGIYSYISEGNPDGIATSILSRFTINRLGNDLETSESILYIFLSIMVTLLFVLSLFFTILTPYSHKVNETGEVIKLTKLKYVKLGLIMLDYILLVWVLNTLVGISDSFLALTIFYGFVSFLFLTLNNLALPFGIFILVLSFFEIIRDTKIQKIINQLGSYRPSNLK